MTSISELAYYYNVLANARLFQIKRRLPMWGKDYKHTKYVGGGGYFKRSSVNK